MHLLPKQAEGPPGPSAWDKLTLRAGNSAIAGPLPAAAVQTAGGAGLGYGAGKLVGWLSGDQDSERAKRYAMYGGLAGLVMSAPSLYGAAVRPRLVQDEQGTVTEKPWTAGSAAHNMFDQWPVAGNPSVEHEQPVVQPSPAT